MRTNLVKRLLGAVGLAAATLLGWTPLQATADTNVALTAARTSLTLPDGAVARMWSYCGAAASGSTGITVGGACVTGGTTWTQGPTIVVPSGDTLKITLSNQLPVPTSITILGQVGGGVGSPVYAKSPVHTGVTVTTFPGNGSAGFTPPGQPDRARSFVPEADGVTGSQTYTWTNLKPGTYLYQSGTRPSLQVPMGLYGVLIVTGTTAAPVAGGPNAAYTATTPALSKAGTAPYPLGYDADATFLFSEVDVAQNGLVDAAAVAMGAATTPSGGNATFSALEQRINTAFGTPGPVYKNPTYVPNDPSLATCDKVACYPPAVNYAPTYFLLNGQSYDKTNPTASAAIVADAVPSGVTPTGRVLARLVNAGLKTHIPTFVGLQSTVVAEDGNLQPDVALGLLKSNGALVSGKAQSSVLLPAGKTTDVVLNPTASTTGLADAAYPLIDRQLSLTAGNKGSGGLQGFLAVAPAGTTAATLTTALSASSTGNALPTAVAVAMQDDVIHLPAGTLSYSGNVLLNDVGVTAVKLSAAVPGLTLNTDGSFTYKPGSAISNTSFSYTGTTSSGAAVLDSTGAPAKATVSFVVTDASTDVVTATPLSFTSQVSTLIRVPHPGVLAGASSSLGYALTASKDSTLPGTIPAAGETYVNTQPTCTGPGACTVKLYPDGAFIASATVPGTYTFPYAAIDAQGKSGSSTVTVVFPQGSGANVVVKDSVLGKPTSEGYRWVLEEDQTFVHDPGNAGFVPPAFPITLSGLSLKSGTSNQVTVSYPAQSNANFKGFVAGTYVQISDSTTDVFNGVYRINTVTGTPSSGGTFTYTLWTTPDPTVAVASSVGTATTGQSLATNFHRSYMPVVATGCTGTGPVGVTSAKSCNDLGVPVSPADVVLDPTKRYFLSVLPDDAGNPAGGIADYGHSMGAANIAGAQITAPASNPVTVLVPVSPLPPAQLSAYVFEDNNPVSGDADEGEVGLGGFQIEVFDVRGSSGDGVGQITYDVFNQPLTNALANTPGTGTDGVKYPNLCPTTPNGQPVPIGTVYTCMPVYNARGVDISPFTGMALIKNMEPGRLDVQAHVGAWRQGLGEKWIQVSTLEGTPNNDTFLHPGEPAYWQEFGPPGFHSFIGFINPDHVAKVNQDTAAAATAAGQPLVSVTGRITNLHMDRPPEAKLNNSCQPGTDDPDCARAALNYTTCYVALNSQSGDGATIAFASCDPNGRFSLDHVPPGSYALFIWDEWLDQIKAKQAVTVPDTAVNGSKVAVDDIPVFNWFTRLQETIYQDLNGNGVRDPGEPGLTNLPLNVRFRDGSFSNKITTDLSGNGFFNEVFPLFNWYVIESDQTRYKNTGVHIIYDAGGIPDQKPLSSPLAPNGEYFSTAGVLNSTEKFPVPVANRIPGAKYNDGTTERIDPGAYVFEGFQGFINQTEFVEFGKQPYAPGENGGIAGMVYYASVRAFDDPRLKVQNLWEPGIPRVKLNLYQRVTNPDGSYTDTLVDTTTSNSWDDWANGTGAFGQGIPNMSCPGNPAPSTTLPGYVAGQTDPFVNYTLGSNNQFKCYDGQHAFNQIQPAVYDGFYAFPTANCAASACTTANWTNPDGSPAPTPILNPGTYVVEVIPPEGFEMTKEEDKNILIGDTWIAAAPQQFGSLVNIFILPDQATLNDNNPEGFSLVFPPCVGTPHRVPDYLSLVPDALQTAPYAGQVRPLCDRKLVVQQDQMAMTADFQLWTPTPIAGHVSGLMLNDAAAEFDPYSPSFGEKFALPNAPISVRDFNGTEILRSYTDKWGTFDFLNVSTWDANVPNPSGYAPNMLTYCMNDPGPTPDPLNPGKYRVDPYYNSQYSDFCYNWPMLPGITTYLDTPVLPVSAFASHYAPVDCQYADLSPAIKRVDGNWIPTKPQAFLPPLATLPTRGVGPYVDMGRGSRTLTITALGDVSVLNPAYGGPNTAANTIYASNRITRHYGFGAAAGTLGQVQLINAAGTATTLATTSWTDGQIVATVPNNLALGEYQLVVRAANGVSTIDTVTVTVDNSVSNRNYRAPWYVAAPAPGTGLGDGQGYGLPHPIQDAIDNDGVHADAQGVKHAKSLPGDLVIIDEGLYPELVVLWKPLKLQGVGAAAVTIQATKYPNSKIADWRNRINLLFGLDPEGNQLSDAAGNALPAQVDPLPGQTVSGGITRLEPSALSTEEGAGITVLAANVQANPRDAVSCANQAALLRATAPSPLVNLMAATPYGFYPGGVSPGSFADPNANQPVAPLPAGGTRNAPIPAQRSFSDFGCYAARIDGLSVTGSDAGGGIYVNGWAHNLQISNNRVYGNSGPYSGGVRIGQPYLQDQTFNAEAKGLAYNVNVKIHHNAITTNGTDEANAAPGTPVGSSGAGGGLAIEAGSDNFVVSNNWICGNFSAGDGGGVGILGNSSPGTLANNTIIFNESYQQTGPSFGGGVAIEGEPGTGTTPSTGVGNIVVDANLIQGNSVRSGSGGGIRLAEINGTEIDNRGNHWAISLTNNVIVNNVAGWAGGGVSMADAAWVTLFGNTIANNDTVGVAGILMNTKVGNRSTGPATAVPGPSGVASEPNSPALIAALNAARLRGQNAPRSTTLSQPTVMANNIIWHNRSFFFDSSSGTAKLCASNRWSDAVNHRCTALTPQTSTGQCDTANAAYWDVGVVGDQQVETTRIALDHSLLSVTYPGTGNKTADPQFAKGYCNGGRVTPGVQFEPGSPFQPAFGLAAAATLDESGNFVDLSFGPLSLQDPGLPAQANGNYHLASATSPAVDAGVTPSAQTLTLTNGNSSHDVDGEPRPQRGGFDMGADEQMPPYADVYVSKDDGVTSLTPGQTTRYTIVVGNNGTLAVNGVQVSDQIASVVTVIGIGRNGNPSFGTAIPRASWTCAADVPGASCAAASGTGSINTTVNLPAVGSVTFTVDVTLPANAAVTVQGGSSQTFINTARASVPAGVPEINLTNNAATDVDSLIPVSVDLAISKSFTANRTSYQPGETVSYTVQVRNLEAVTAAALVAVNDTPPALLQGVSWTCAASTGSACGAASGNGAIAETNASLAPQGVLTYTLTGRIPLGTARAASLDNTATVALNPVLGSDPQAANNRASVTGTVQYAAATLTPAQANLGQVQLGQTSPAVFTLTNTGTVPMFVAAPQLTLVTTPLANPAQMVLSASTCPSNATLGAGASCTYTVRFQPTVTGNTTANLLIDGGAGPLTTQVFGQGIPPVIVVGTASLGVNPGALALTSTPANTTTKSATLTLRNTGTAPLNLGTVTISTVNTGRGRFSYANGPVNCPINGGSLAIGASCSLTVTYAPNVTANNSGTLTINTPGASTPFTQVTLSGN